MLKIYTDGGVLQEDERKLGAWAYIILKDEILIASGSGTKYKTHTNEMEMMAVLEALRHLEEQDIQQHVSFFSDSQYVIDGCRANNISKRQKILDSTIGDNFSCRQMWEEIWQLSQEKNIMWQWIRGHNGDYGNEVVDKLNKMAMNYFLEHWNTGGTSERGIWIQEDLNSRAHDMLEREKSRSEGSMKKKGFSLRKCGDLLIEKHQPHKKYIVVLEKIQWAGEWGVGCVLLGQKNSLEIIGFGNHKVDNMIKVKTSRKEDAIIEEVLFHFSSSYEMLAHSKKTS